MWDVIIFPAIMSHAFVSMFPVAKLPISVFCLTASALVYGVIKVKLSFQVVVRRIREIGEHSAHCNNFGVMSKWQLSRMTAKDSYLIDVLAKNYVTL